MDSDYNVLEEFHSLEAGMQLDPHDFGLIGNGTSIIQAASIDHSPLVGSESEMGYRTSETPVKEAIFQAVDIATRRVDFEWRSLDHVLVDETCLPGKHPDYL